MPNIGPFHPSPAENAARLTQGALASKLGLSVGPQTKGQDTENCALRAEPSYPRGQQWSSLAFCPTISWPLISAFSPLLEWGGKSPFLSCFSLRSPRTNDSMPRGSLRVLIGY